MRARIALLGVLALVTTPAVGLVGVQSGQAHAAMPSRCHGKPATIVGTPGSDAILGTSQADVIVTGPGPDSVERIDGNDSVCTGSGHDFVEVGAGRNWVDAGPDGDQVMVDGCHCVVRGGPGNDFIHVVASAHVRVFAGAGSDRIQVVGKPWIRPQSYAGGPGRDWISVHVARSRTGHPYPRFVLDLGRGWFTSGARHVPVTDFEQAVLNAVGSQPRAEAYVLRGSDADNVLTVNLGDHEDLHPAAVLRGLAGDDELRGSRGDDLLDGGPGIDSGRGERGIDTCVSIEETIRNAPTTCEISR
jgi:Ca2+-binding RTX toxin-like protein